VIPPRVEYAAPDSVAEAVSVLAEAGEDAKIIAGGQSLLPVLRLRLAYPSLLVDLAKVSELRGVRDAGAEIVIGAITRHADVIGDPLVRAHAGLIAEATATVADPAVRHRGTFGGSLAHADPADSDALYTSYVSVTLEGIAAPSVYVLGAVQLSFADSPTVLFAL